MTLIFSSPQVEIMIICSISYSKILEDDYDIFFI
jgi:hypothetical protein